MNLKRIRTFMMVVEHKNFSVVAELLDVSQPAVSKQIKTLEEELGVVLLHRESIEPTEAGRFVYQKGKELMRDWQQLVDECRSMQGELSGLLRIGTSTIPGSYLLPAFFGEFRKRYPRVEFRISVNSSEEVLHLLRDGKLEIGIVGVEPKGDPFVSHLIGEDHMVMIGPADSDEVDGFGDIKNLPFIFRQSGSGTWEAAKEALQKWGGSVDELRSVAEVDSTEAVISMVEAGIGYSIISDLAALPATKHGRVKVLASLPETRGFYLTYLTIKRQNPAIDALVNLLVRE
ncbi:selenium metabolism-associated LysR family transcriptional regulator [Effusibacillus dendaii]|uniref:LysR family transcriptional regulator n=1 Tax=Effusibacillus dendaii TaxID=2743772 RepID=A0A7I8D9J8_9BACL|nr:selenium metabolism-associated LysR family transcriptional regulator [Effusibacillus dendaii]BCJ86755.1 LysR family transcriptional regulator [Effusibacillus dendaii]